VAKLVSDVLDVRIAPVEYDIQEGRGTIKIGDVLLSEMEPYRGPDGKPTKIIDSIFSTIPGSPAYIAKAPVHRVNIPEFNLSWEYNGRNAIQGLFRFEE
jgi:hypothetical protein